VEEIKRFEVSLTSSAKLHFFEFVEYLYEHLTPERANKKLDELQAKLDSLETFPERGAIEPQLKNKSKGHRSTVFKYTSRKTIKIIYLIDPLNQVVYITDFFPTEMNPTKVAERNS
jgi:plasmid stabilization system protein ParE